MGIGSKFQKFKDKVFDRTRKLIPNELADLAVKAAPFVAPFDPKIAAIMRGIGRFDQRGDPIDALKQAAATYVGGKVVGKIPGTENYFGKGFEGAKALGSDALSGIRSLGTSGKNKAADILGKGKEPFGSADDVYPGMEKSGSGSAEDKGIMSTIFDKGKELVFGKDKKFQMGDIGRFLGDPGKTVPLTMIASYIKEKFFPDEDQDSFDAKFAEAMRKRGENVEGYLRQYGPFDPRRDPTKNPYTQQEIDQFAKDKTIEYRNAADGGLMTLPREDYFLGGKSVTTVNPNPDFERASKVTSDDILNVFKDKFFFKGRSPAKGPRQLGLLIPPDNAGRVPKASKVSSDDILNVFKEKFDGGNFFGSGSPRLALPMGRRVSATFSPKQALTAERAFDVDDTKREIRDFFERRLRGMPASFRPELIENEEIRNLLSSGDKKGLDALMTSLLRDANFDREKAAMGGRMNYASGSEGIMMASNPDPMDERNQVLEMMSMQTFGKPLRDLSDDQIIELEEMFDDFISSGQPLPDKQMAFMDDDYESEFMRLVGEFMEQGFSQEEAIEAARDELGRKSIATGGRVNYAEGTKMASADNPFFRSDYADEHSYRMFGKPYKDLTVSELEEFREEMERLRNKFMADGGRVNYAMGGDTPEENAMQAAGIEGLDLNINPKGITELDMRETGGFIPPVGVKEKEDDIPAMLSNNEFVFTADAVRGMGEGDVDKGAERMYSMMKKLEDGGRV